jgi:putative SOS response-associated peptidase YedK
MCGRYEAGQKQKIAEAFHVSVELNDSYFSPGTECAPGSIQPVIYMKDGQREVGEMRWGFKLPDRLLFNARSEGIATAKFWQGILNERRCIVPASSFFEWKKTASGPKPRYRLSIKRRHIFGMAGVWQAWKNPKTDQLEPTFAIITTDANVIMGEIHNRQPVVLEPKEYAEWLEDGERLPIHLLRILSEEDLVVDPVEHVKVESKMIMPKQHPSQFGLFDT